MTPNNKCPFCSGATKQRTEKYNNVQGELVVSVEIPYCEECDACWLPIEEEKKVDSVLESKGLTMNQLIREVQ